ncbi:MAG: polysaccharide deacetylase family protein [Acidobacteriota bacterium]|nr:polysaccharide deacetylase family protein [Acidobacteriota bacterium]
MNLKCVSLMLLFYVAVGVPVSRPQTVPKTLAEKLGYPRGAKLLIVHADDVGMTHSVNAATMVALENGYVNSASIMVPCPWFPEIADYAKTHPDSDLGLHLTLTSERVYYRWGPVAPKDKVPSLVDSNGYFHIDWSKDTHIDPKEAELEVRAQIDRAFAMGVRPTHLDSHQYRLIDTGPELFEVFARVAHAYKLPLFVTRDWFAQRPYLESSLSSDDIVVDHTVTIEPSVPAEKWGAFYQAALENLQPGVTEFVVHVAYNNDEMKAATRERDTWGAAWRQRDFDFFSSEEFRRLLQERNIKLVTWRELVRAGKQ